MANSLDGNPSRTARLAAPKDEERAAARAGADQLEPVRAGRRLLLRLQEPQVWLVLLAALVVLAPLLRPGYFWGAHDARHDVYFLFEFDKSIQEGILFPRWGPDWAFGYGYPFWIVYAPLATYVGELIHLAGGLGWEDSVKAVLALSILLSGLGMYGFARSWLGRNAALVAAVAYMAIPYHLVDVFVRAALPESLAVAMLPLVVWAYRECLRRPGWGTVLAAGIAYAALMWTSNLVAVIFTPTLAIYVVLGLIWQAREQRPATLGGFGRLAAAPALSLCLGLALSAAFFVPALIEMRYVNQTQWFGEYYNPFQHFVYFNQLFDPTWGFGISQPGPDDAAQGGLSFQLGGVPVLLALISVSLSGRLGRRLRSELRFWAAWAAVAITLTLGISAPAWRYLPLIRYAQFPWRYLMLAMLPLSLLAGSLVRIARDREPGEHEPEPLHWPAVLLAGLLLAGSYPYLQVQNLPPTPEQGPVSDMALMRFERTSDEMTGVTAWVDPAQRPMWSPMADEWVAGRTVSTRVDYSNIPQNETLAVNAEGMGTIQEKVWYHAQAAGQQITFNRFWYPGWKAYLLDGKDGRPAQELPVLREDGPLARTVVPVPAGEGYLLLRFEETPLRTGARLVSVVAAGVAALVVLARVARRWRRR